MKYFISGAEVTKEIFNQRAKNHTADDITFIDECDAHETEMHLHSELEYAFTNLTHLEENNYQYDSLIGIMIDETNYDGLEQAGNLLILYFIDGIIVLTPHKSLQKFYK